ncbi:cupin-like domain-containing protein [Sphingomonas cannabina]|uniref:cupin-like domain-containing protein n=1 Tax=Sphingomonas cannabina TaxID=2899123 RepID=UPI001F27D14D|nr:cupin-like domain-containing protein [Sphingomonas cannabina]UIJ44726.1 cupin-like domain-containing protein [Sphingomonas cannabina]
MNAETRPLTIERRTEVVTGVAAGDVPLEALAEAQRPTIFKGAVAHWPLVQAGLASPKEAIAYLSRFDAGRPITLYVGDPAIRGRFHYTADATAMNFAAERAPLPHILARLEAHLDDPDPPAFYVGSTDVDLYLPGLRAANDLRPADGLFERHPPLMSIWIGNRTIASAHYDMSNNVACCVAGHRRFTLFPPDQVANLYPGPLAPTPGGQVVSMVDFAAPDLDRYPRFADAIANAEIAELEPGDVLVYPALWWHHVEALDRFNILVNYWWNAVPAFMDTPMTTLLHGLLSLRDRPDSERQAWRTLFDYYLFGDPERPAAHIPEAARGPLAPLDPTSARQLRALLINRLNR